ncbi:hypothetical protein NDU88_003100 [Pleurodeles waltl]|uniref:Uncharacterized protein n=1 Tax=Pleurodeles waltl TaxID=8319 RepID=A0AAV7WS41_PLEWA|nr:hypothetical protein NDU88_003100 [Pleurodeles waltl]
MVKLHGPEGASGAQRRASQGLRPPPQSQSAPYLVLCHQRSAGFQMRSAGRQKSLCAGSLGNIRGLQPSPSAGPEFRPTPHPVSALSARARYALIIDRGPELSRRGPGNQDALRETPSEGRERSAKSGPPAAARTRSRSSRKKGGGGEPRSDTTADQAPPKSLVLPSSHPSIGGSSHSPHSPRAHRGSRHARRTAGARPLAVPPPPGPRQQPNPAQTAPSETSGGSPRGPLPLRHT